MDNPTSITPFLTVKDGKKAVEFYISAFGAVEIARYPMADDKLTSKIAIESAEFWVGDEEPHCGNLRPEVEESTSIRIILKTNNADKLYANALKFGAVEICPMTTEAVWRIGKLKDPFGHIWEIGYIVTHNKKTTTQENWINHPTILTGETVELVPLEKEHFEELYLAASDKKLWELIPVDCSKRETFDSAYNFALTERDMENQYPFVIYHKATNEIIGSTRFFEIYPLEKKLEIAWTWIIEKYWGTVINFECKLLLLSFCFDTLKTRRVQIKTDATNLRSRKAIEKIGGQFEGILRKDKIKENGISRSAAYYSILDDEWEEAKLKIMSQIKSKTRKL